ncbi:MAG: ribonuclease HII [Candidatus Levybacteria bacterium]|nr:ribonuclease HII [Candidatus Levybacteria bacterium]
MERPTFHEELQLWRQGYKAVVGLDEVGRGAFAGPLVAAGVMFPAFFSETLPDKDAVLLLASIRDSKQLTALTRNRLAILIKEYAFCSSVVEISVSSINRFGVGKANRMAFRLVLNSLYRKLQEKGKNLFVLIDGFHVSYLKGGRKQQKAIVKGDQKSISIAAASILAKVYRDMLMDHVPPRYKKYKFSHHKGYGTAEHRKLIRRYGLSRLHRTSFNLGRFAAPLDKA